MQCYRLVNYLHWKLLYLEHESNMWKVINHATDLRQDLSLFIHHDLERILDEKIKGLYIKKWEVFTLLIA